MNILIRAELLKLRTLRSFWWTVAATLAVVAVSIAISMHGGVGSPEIETTEGFRNVMAAASSGAVLMLIIGILMMAGEFRHNTITSTLTRMEKAGLSVREKHEKDRRAHRVKVLAAGKRAFQDAQKIAIALQSQVLAVLPPDRRERFLEDLEIVAESCAAALEKPAGKSRKTS